MAHIRENEGAELEGQAPAVNAIDGNVDTVPLTESANSQQYGAYDGVNGSSAMTPEMEARKQLLIESLIGMGFPVDWALRAAEHCDASVSESTAITWIIER